MILERTAHTTWGFQ